MLEDRIPENHLLRRMNVFVTVAPAELDWTDKQRQTRAVAEYLAALDEAADPDPNRKPEKVMSPSDPSSVWTAKANKRVQFGYGLNYLIDIDEAVSSTWRRRLPAPTTRSRPLRRCSTAPKPASI